MIVMMILMIVMMILIVIVIIKANFDQSRYNIDVVFVINVLDNQNQI